MIDEDEPVAVLAPSVKVAEQDFAIPKAPRNLNPVTWVPAGGKFQIAGMTIEGGLVYVVTGRMNRSSMDPSYIDPSVPVATEGNFRIRSMEYWPSYTQVTPTARRSYLEWLAGGRCHPEADIGFVFLFFYGLERRALGDGLKDPEVRAEWPVIVRELERLIDIYGSRSTSFKNYAGTLLGLLTTKLEDKMYLQPLPALPSSYELPLALRIAIGQAMGDGVPIPKHLASAWIRHDPNAYLRTPATRCPSEFDVLFGEQYTKVYGEGMVIPRNKTKLRYVYRPATSAQGSLGEVKLSFGDIPDVSALTKPVSDLRLIAELVTTDLDAYSRYLGRNPDGAAHLGAILLLPRQVWPEATREAFDQLRLGVAEAPIVCTFSALLSRMGSSEVFNKERTLALATSLNAAGIGFEPDVLAGSKIPKPDDHVVLFDLPAPEEVRTTSAFQAAALTLQLASSIAVADGGFDDAEVKHLRDQIEAWVHLTPAHRARLAGHLSLLVTSPVSLTSLKKRLEVLDAQAKESIASFMSILAQADGAVSAKEVKALEKIYKVLGFDSKKVFSDLNSAGAGLNGGSKVASGSTGGFKLDQARIAALQEDTAKVSALLANIFAEDGDKTPPVAVEPTPEAGELQADASAVDQVAILGLDAQHAAFARMLLTRNEWVRSELQDVADDMDLMLDGALERVNEAAFDAHDIPFTEGDDPIEINTELREKIEA